MPAAFEHRVGTMRENYPEFVGRGCTRAAEGADYRRHSLSPVVPPPVPISPSLRGDGGSITGPSVSVTSRRPIGADESIVFGHSIGPRYHPGVLNVSLVSPRIAKLPGNFVAVRRFVHYPPSPTKSILSRHHPTFVPSTPLETSYMLYPLSSFWRHRLIGT